MKSEGFHSVANQKLPGEPMCTHWLGFFFLQLVGRFSIQIIKFIPTRDVSGLSDYSSSFKDKNKGDRGWLLLFLQKIVTCSGSVDTNVQSLEDHWSEKGTG